MNKDIAWQLVRYLLLAAGGYATAKGWIEDDQVIAVVGALGTLFAVAWGLFVKWNTKAVPTVVADEAAVPTVSPLSGKVQ